MSLIEVRLRPTTPWRVGHGAGDRERVDVVYHSDALYSALTHAMKTLGWLEEWLAATAQSDAPPVVRFSSLFPFIGKTRLIAPPKTWWPPANPGRLYTEAARLIPLEVVRNGITDESRWMVDGETGCMFHTGSGAPVKIAVRAAAAVDRLTGVADPHRIACLEFASNAGWWGVFAVDDSQWESRVKSAFRLLADSGFGGERSRGWGRAAAPEFSDASSLLPSQVHEEGAWWLLSMYSPHADDAVDWSRGEYDATQRGGWTDSQAGIAPKKQVRMLEEGSVLFAPALRGRSVDVAPDGFPHPVYRSGFALAVPAPPEPVLRQPQQPDIMADILADALANIEPEAQPEPEAAMEAEGAPPEPVDLGTPVQPEAQPEPEAAMDAEGAPPEPVDLSTPIQPEAQPEPEAAMEAEGAPPEPVDLSTPIQPEAQPEPEAAMEAEGAPPADEEPK